MKTMDIGVIRHKSKIIILVLCLGIMRSHKMLAIKRY